MERILDFDRLMASDSEHVLPDAELVDLFRGGDREAFKTLAQRYWRSLFRLLHRYTRNTHDAEDLLQKTLLRALDGLGTLGGEVNFVPGSSASRSTPPTTFCDNDSARAGSRTKRPMAAALRVTNRP